MNQNILRPKKRNFLRKWLGKRYFIFKRRMFWWFGTNNFSTSFIANTLPEEITTHQTPLIRQLKDVDMKLQFNKITNLKIAAKQLSGVIIKPGEVFSFWYLVGQPSWWKGYKKGMVLSEGKVISGIGGGLCQMGNLIFWMALHTPLTIVERYRHSYDVFPDANRTQPFGSGATLAFNYIDLQIKNETEQDFQLKTWLSEKYLHGGFYSSSSIQKLYKVIEQNHKMIHQPWGGYTRHNEILREIYDNASMELLHKELVTANHAIMMYQPFLNPSEEKDQKTL